MVELKKIVIIGAGGFGREVLEIIKRINSVDHQYDILGFIDDNKEIFGTLINEHEVLGGIEWIKSSKQENIHFVCAIGDPKVKKHVIQKALDLGYIPGTIIDPSVNLNYNVKIGEGSIICPGNQLTTNINIKKHVIINQICSIGHDVSIGDYSTINPLSAISGGVKLGEGCFIGTGAKILQYQEIGDWSVVGASACVINNIPDYKLAIGVPAKIKKDLK